MRLNSWVLEPLLETKLKVNIKAGIERENKREGGCRQDV